MCHQGFKLPLEGSVRTCLMSTEDLEPISKTRAGLLTGMTCYSINDFPLWQPCIRCLVSLCHSCEPIVESSEHTQRPSLNTAFSFGWPCMVSGNVFRTVWLSQLDSSHRSEHSVPFPPRSLGHTYLRLTHCM